MIRAAIATLVPLIFATPALAGPRVAAIVGPDGDGDIRTALLIGPSGQLYTGDGTGRWVRSMAGGIAGDVTGAARIDGAVIVAGASTPMYRFDGTGWAALKLGQSGKTVFGRGPWPAVAIGKHVFLHRPAKGQVPAGWVRVGEVPGVVTAVWAQSARKVFAVTGLGVHALRDKVFVRTRDPVATIVGSSPWGVAADGVIDLATGRQAVAATGVVAAAGGATAPWVIASDGAATLRLVGKTGTAPRTIATPIPAGTVVDAIAADKAGRIAIATADGMVHLWVDDAWSTGSLVDELPVARPGPGPASTR